MPTLDELATQAFPAAPQVQQAQPLSLEEKALLFQKQLLQSSQPQPTVHEPPVYPDMWGPGYNTLNGLTQGLFKRMVSPETKRSAAQWEKENPGMAIATELGGSMSSAIPAMALGQEYAVAPLAARLGGFGRFLLGTAGEGMEGLTGVGVRTGSRAASGALQGAESAALSSGLHNQPLAEQLGIGAITGGALQPVAAPIGQMVGSNISPAVAKMGQKFTDLDVPLRPEQIPGVGPTRTLLSKWFGGGVGEEEQLKAFTRAIGRTFGENTDELTGNVISRAQDRIGRDMTNSARRLNIDTADPRLQAEWASLRARATNNLTGDELAKVDKLLDGVEKSIKSGLPITGEEYQSMTQMGSSLMGAIKSNNSLLRHYGSEARDVLDDALERSAQASGAQGALKRFQDARAEWKNGLVARELVDETTGNADVKKLFNQVKKKYGGTARAGDLGTLAEGSKNFLRFDATEGGSHLGDVAKIGLGSGLAGMAILGAEHGAVPLGHHMMAHPAEGLAALGVLGGLYGAGRVGARYANSPGATRRLLDIAAGDAQPLLRGINPLIPAASNFYREPGANPLNAQ